MKANLLNDARCFLVASLQGKPDASESRHLWRKGWEFAVMHSLRVEQYVLKILAREVPVLSAHEIGLLQLAAILHDIARLNRQTSHAKTGAEIAKLWLTSHPSHRLTDRDIDRVVEMIATHSDKQGRESDLSKAILKDADTLDEIGAMSIFMSSNWLESDSPFFLSPPAHKTD